MSLERVKEKLNILTDAAKYGVSCSSSGSNLKTPIKVWVIPVWVFAIAILKMGEMGVAYHY